MFRGSETIILFFVGAVSILASSCHSLACPELAEVAEANADRTVSPLLRRLSTASPDEQSEIFSDPELIRWIRVQARRAGASENDLDDVSNETLLRLWESADEYRG